MVVCLGASFTRSVNVSNGLWHCGFSVAARGCGSLISPSLTGFGKKQFCISVRGSRWDMGQGPWSGIVKNYHFPLHFWCSLTPVGTGIWVTPPPGRPALSSVEVSSRLPETFSEPLSGQNSKQEWQIDCAPETPKSYEPNGSVLV